MDSSCHMAVTALTIAGMVLVVVWHLILAAQVRPPFLPIVTTLGHLAIVTALFKRPVRNVPGTQSFISYFLVVAATAVRCSLPAVWLATVGSVARVLRRTPVLGHDLAGLAEPPFRFVAVRHVHAGHLRRRAPCRSMCPTDLPHCRE